MLLLLSLFRLQLDTWPLSLALLQDNARALSNMSLSRSSSVMDAPLGLSTLQGTRDVVALEQDTVAMTRISEP